MSARRSGLETFIHSRAEPRRSTLVLYWSELRELVQVRRNIPGKRFPHARGNEPVGCQLSHESVEHGTQPADYGRDLARSLSVSRT